MSGIYIHIPFCKQKCFYCDFYSVASIKNRTKYIEAVVKELELQKDYLGKEHIETIYFGGGTPSLLSIAELEKILSTIHNYYNVSSKPEITIEANPDDLNIDYLKELHKIKFNRLSIGIQSFDDNVLKFINRRHNSAQAINSVYNAKEAGFDNISIDLIYGLPDMTLSDWKENINKAMSLDIQHLSAYHLTIEEKTVFANYLSKGKIKPIEEAQSIEQFKTLIERVGEGNFIHYEISNFCKPNFYSKHNSNYWKQKKYLGIGSSAHSYNLNSRSWNVRSIEKYIASLENDTIPCETEQLDNNTRYNDYILTSLRTMWGADLNYIKTAFGDTLYTYYINNAKKYIDTGMIYMKDNTMILSDEAKFISDQIIADLFVV